MKTLQLFLITLSISAIGFAQNGINYKALIKDTNGNVISNQTVDIQFSILQASTVVYEETHNLTTNQNGLVITNIGEGTVISGDFDAIDWASDDHFLNVQVDTGSGLTDLGTTKFMAVPYALSSGDHPWTKNDNGVHSIDTNIGINRENPEHTLDVRSMSQSEAAQFNISNSDKSRYVRFFSGSDTFPNPSMSWAPGNSLLFATYDDNTFDFQEKMQISALGDVGIGITNPEAKLDIKGGDWNLDAGNPGDLRIGNATHNFRIGIATGGGGAGITRMYTNSNALILGVNNAPMLIMESNGEIKAPSMTNTLIDNAGDKALVTKEYVDANSSPNTDVAFKCRLSTSATTQILQNFTEQQINFEYVDYNFGSGIFNASNSSFTIPHTGVYTFDNKLVIDFDDTNSIAIVSKIYVNGVLRISNGKQFELSYNNNWAQYINFTEQLSLSQGDVITYYITAGFTTSGELPRVINNTSMSIYKIY
jgi:hypothetical protein